MIRVLDLTDDLAPQAARLFVGLGADVVRVDDGTSSDELHWHAGKRVVRGDLDTVLARLLPGADVVLESGPLRRLRTPSRREASPEDWAHVVHVVVTPFGMWGPRQDWLADDLVASAAGGMTWLGGDPGQPPVPPPRDQAGQLAGDHAAIAALLGLLARRRTGRGQLAEVSVQEAVAATLETGAIAWLHGGTVPGRTSGVYGHVAHRVFAAKDGHVAGGYSGPDRMWTDLLAWLVEEDEAGDLSEERWQDPVYRWQNRPHVDDVVAAFVARRTVDEIASEARARALPWAAVAAPSELADNPQLRYRNFFVDIDTPSGPVTNVGFPFASRRRLSAPAHVDTVDWPARDLPPPASGRGAALDGTRVLDLTWVLAGPYVTKILGEHGADIVKVESAHRQDPTRFAPSMRLRPGASPDESGYFLNFNRNKRSMTLNLRTPRAQEVLRRLVAEVDVVIENFSPGVLDKWGLGYEQMRQINPNVILVSMAGVGQTGPWRRAVTFADTLAAMSGLTHETGNQGLTFGLGDIVAANAAALATLDLLYRGHGGYVDLSQLEAMAAHLGPAMLTPPPPKTTRVLRTRGEDRWIAVATDDLDPSTVATEDADELAVRLQAQGIAAYPVRDGRDLVESDEQLAAGGFYVELDHPLAGRVAHEGVVARLHDTPGGVWTPAPLLGQHTDELLAELLGLTAPELDSLRADGVLE
ncbi:CaiB/BaiF CoA-transferase family protein [Actinophytocola sp.]|uniref:CaiB/BaiF CoA-transferase family protein n=1 Tax=Actinophytocola sp. TaxID=1872138 RepID=UPI002ED40069